MGQQDGTNIFMSLELAYHSVRRRTPARRQIDATLTYPVGVTYLHPSTAELAVNRYQHRVAGGEQIGNSGNEGHARALLALPSAQLQRQALAIIEQRGLNVRETEQLVRRMQLESDGSAAEGAAREPRQLSPQDRDAVEKFQACLGTRVNLVRGKTGGRVVIHFYSEEELQAIYEAIVGDE